MALNATPVAYPGSPLHLNVEFCANPPAHAARWLHGDRVFTPGNQYGTTVLAYAVKVSDDGAGVIPNGGVMDFPSCAGSAHALLQGGETHLRQHARKGSKDLLLYCFYARWRCGGDLQRELHQTPPTAVELHRRRRGGGAQSAGADPLSRLQWQSRRWAWLVGGSLSPAFGRGNYKPPLDLVGTL